MITIFKAALAAAAASLAACGGSDDATPANPSVAQQDDGSAFATTQSGAGHSGSGDITEISDNKATISHGPVESIGWPAMTMTFQAEGADMLKGLNVGDPVDFQFRAADGQHILTSIEREKK